MESLPLARSAPFDEIPARMEPLFAELAPSGARPVEVTVTVPEGTGRRVVMHIVTAEVNAGHAFSLAFRACEGVDGFEIAARRFRALLLTPALIRPGLINAPGRKG